MAEQPDGTDDTTSAGLVASAEDGVLLLRLDRGAKRNAVDQPLADALDRELARLEDDPALSVAVLTGDERCFSAGTDLTLGASPTTPEGGAYGLARRQRSKPVVAAVEGYAVGGGFEIVLACDLVVASRTAYFALPEVKRGLVANCGALFRAPEKLPVSVALHLLLTGAELSAERAYGLGLVNQLAEPGQAVAEALTLARAVHEVSPAAVRATMKALAEARAEAEYGAWPLTERAAAEVAAAPDSAEGVAAFFERRAPRWQRG